MLRTPLTKLQSATRGLYLHWEGKRLYRQKIPTPRILEPVPSLSVGTGHENMVVEGDLGRTPTARTPRAQAGRRQCGLRAGKLGANCCAVQPLCDGAPQVGGLELEANDLGLYVVRRAWRCLAAASR